MAAHEQSLRIYYQDTDATGVVFHGAYLAFAERGRVDALHAVGASAKALTDAHGLAFLVRRAELQYVRPLRLDDVVAMRTATLQVRGASCRIRQDFLRDGALTTRVEVDLACVRAADGRPVRIPPRWASALEALADETAIVDGPALPGGLGET